MTTIAWDGRTLAADRLGVNGGLRCAARKIQRCGEYVYANAGARHDTIRIAEWLTAGAHPDARPTFDEGGSWGIAIHAKTGRAFKVEGKTVVLCEVFATRMADGSGRDYALAAMHLGKTAAQAVRVAAHFDVYTGGGVDYVRIVPRRGRARP